MDTVRSDLDGRGRQRRTGYLSSDSSTGVDRCPMVHLARVGATKLLRIGPTAKSSVLEVLHDSVPTSTLASAISTTSLEWLTNNTLSALVIAAARRSIAT